MGITKDYRREDQELITSPDLVQSAHALMGDIDLDVASSVLANNYVQAKEFYTPQDDGLNEQEWYGKCYLFPPSGTYFFDKKLDKWRMTRCNATVINSSHSVWFQKLYYSWLKGKVEQAIFFTNCTDIIRYEQKIFDFPVCILRTAPELIKNSSKGLSKHRTSTSLVVYLQPKNNSGQATENFLNIYSEKGRILY